MTTHARILYESFVGPIELREGIVRRAEVGLTRAVRLRHAIGLVAALTAGLEAAELFCSVSWLSWSSGQRAALTLGLAGAWLIAAVNAWCCRQRVEVSRARLLEYVDHLPVA